MAIFWIIAILDDFDLFLKIKDQIICVLLILNANQSNLWEFFLYLVDLGIY